jgi:hypothetical protein
MDWQPIETAPKDGTLVLVFSPGDFQTTTVASYTDAARRPCWTAEGPDGRACDSAGDWQTLLDPTHWMPLPASPQD